MSDTPRYPSFQAQTGHAPVAGIDYDPDDTPCQDDYEFFTGTGRYTDDPGLACKMWRDAIQSRLASITTGLEKLDGAATWPVAGDLEHIEALLAEVDDFTNAKGEYAK